MCSSLPMMNFSKYFCLLLWLSITFFLLNLLPLLNRLVVCILLFLFLLVWTEVVRIRLIRCWVLVFYLFLYFLVGHLHMIRAFVFLYCSDRLKWSLLVCWPGGKSWGFTKHWAAKCPILLHLWQVILDISLKGTLELIAFGLVFALGRGCYAGLGMNFGIVLGGRFTWGDWLSFSHISVFVACVCASVIVVVFWSRICDPNSLFRFKRYLFIASYSPNLILILRSAGFICLDWMP